MNGRNVAGREARRISVAGVVQGVGFRPFVYNLASHLGLVGWVLNHSGGVDIEIEGTPAALEAFLAQLVSSAPPLARIESIQAGVVPPRGYVRFEIRHSESQTDRYQLISPDVATCPDCLREIFDPADRRYRYPFTNCTNCGPRFTIIADIPYDRPNTTMRVFPMCPDCQREYDDPANRRFHAQPNACPICGPHLWLTDPAGRPLAGDERRADNERVLNEAREALLAGKIVAVKGLGGFLLACDATNAGAVQILRQRKRRPHKPFAVMVATLEEARRYCVVSPAEEELLCSPACPIVLLERRSGISIADEVAPHQRTLGIMLPYTPLHHLLLRDVGRPLVMTSGNLSEEPIACENEEALRRLAGLADVFLFHNRDIYSRYDDSVWHMVKIEGGARTRLEVQPVRRARGYAPFPIKLPFMARPLLAAGADLKNTFCLARDGYAFLSQHIGDMENLETIDHFQNTLALYRHLFRLEPAHVACDLHPDYLSTRLAREYAASAGLGPPLQIQHHSAHIASCLADNAWGEAAGAVIGVALDGTGYGDDGAIWGGEWLVGDYRGFRRAAHLEYLPLPGGDAATRRPARIAAGYLYALLGADAIPAGLIADELRPVLSRQIDRRLNTPFTSSMGRLFDAVSALLGICREISYEAQAAIELEQVAGRQASELVAKDACDVIPLSTEMYSDGAGGSLPFKIDAGPDCWVVRLGPLLVALLDELRCGVPIVDLARRFHLTVAEMIVRVCEKIRAETGLMTVALSGGCFQSRLLTSLTIARLEGAGFHVLLHRQVPANDGGLALGQAALAHFRIASTR